MYGVTVLPNHGAQSPRRVHVHLASTSSSVASRARTCAHISLREVRDVGVEDLACISFILKGMHGVKHVQDTRGQHGDHLELGPADVPGRYPADGYYLVAVRQYAGAMTLSAAAVVGVVRTQEIRCTVNISLCLVVTGSHACARNKIGRAHV